MAITSKPSRFTELAGRAGRAAQANSRTLAPDGHMIVMQTCEGQPS